MHVQFRWRAFVNGAVCARQRSKALCAYGRSIRRQHLVAFEMVCKDLPKVDGVFGMQQSVKQGLLGNALHLARVEGHDQNEREGDSRQERGSEVAATLVGAC